MGLHQCVLLELAPCIAVGIFNDFRGLLQEHRMFCKYTFLRSWAPGGMFVYIYFEVFTLCVVYVTGRCPHVLAQCLLFFILHVLASFERGSYLLEVPSWSAF